MDQPCLGMTDCSICHSSNGFLCRECLKNRYGEELEEVRANKEWICPHCTEEKGINPYWFCNRLLCLKKRNIALTVNTFKARKMGYKSVAHMLMDQLQGAVKGGDDKLFG
uniref:Zinc-finger domain-containing protein n=2 Tax=Solanum TaxID=4107 RepID=M1B481_SOLTU